jgi:hypothetical protein
MHVRLVLLFINNNNNKIKGKCCDPGAFVICVSFRLVEMFLTRAVPRVWCAAKNIKQQPPVLVQYNAWGR